MMSYSIILSYVSSFFVMIIIIGIRFAQSLEASRPRAHSLSGLRSSRFWYIWLYFVVFVIFCYIISCGAMLYWINNILVFHGPSEV